jgi:dethiobiotin synthetase
VSGFVVAVAGTGTSVGKTHVCQALSHHGRGTIVVWKPIESGAGDTEELRRAGPTEAALYSFREPISPHLAARREGASIDLDRIVRVAHELAAEVLVIETAGGLFSPLGVGVTNADLIRALAPDRVLLVAPDRLGVLHDVGAAVTAARAVGLAIDSVVLSAPEMADASTHTNRRELENTVGIRVAAEFPRARFDAAESLARARETLDALGAPASLRRHEDPA